MSLIDSHCHLDSAEFDADREEVIQRALDAGVAHMVAIGTGHGPPDLEAGIRLAEKHSSFYATAGIHPHDAAKASPADFKRLAELLLHPKVIAAGEIGLDYHYDFSPRETQQSVFVEQMRIAAEARKPIVIHTREAWEDTLALIQQHWAAYRIGGVMHCFSGGPAEAQRALALGFYLSFGGILTFPKALEVQSAARTAPPDRILIETDAPYLAPVPKRGKRNEPALIVHTARKLAELRGSTIEEIGRATTENFQRLLCPGNQA
ncbi:MAG TPA: TatD family hydrolase [Bryobacteraceae bacterium]|nr:TatD family hydrolase [Bryobacteraceae bacterium]